MALPEVQKNLEKENHPSHLIFVHIFIHFKYMDCQLVWPGYLAVWRENNDLMGMLQHYNQNHRQKSK